MSRELFTQQNEMMTPEERFKAVEVMKGRLEEDYSKIRNAEMERLFFEQKTGCTGEVMEEEKNGGENLHRPTEENHSGNKLA